MLSLLFAFIIFLIHFKDCFANKFNSNFVITRVNRLAKWRREKYNEKHMVCEITILGGIWSPHNKYVIRQKYSLLPSILHLFNPITFSSSFPHHSSFSLPLNWAIPSIHTLPFLNGSFETPLYFISLSSIMCLCFQWWLDWCSCYLLWRRWCFRHNGLVTNTVTLLNN